MVPFFDWGTTLERRLLCREHRLTGDNPPRHRQCRSPTPAPGNPALHRSARTRPRDRPPHRARRHLPERGGQGQGGVQVPRGVFALAAPRGHPPLLPRHSLLPPLQGVCGRQLRLLDGLDPAQGGLHRQPAAARGGVPLRGRAHHGRRPHHRLRRPRGAREAGGPDQLAHQHHGDPGAPARRPARGVGGAGDGPAAAAGAGPRV
mmetsp:Transcript_9251/g.19873  ORF Transcript_9251/g.19873 Transcript_9251/m.19873 type:complete len:204 (+) Transcript_9251:405-1016(+)